MLAVKAKYDGRKVILPKKIKSAKPGNVIVIFENARSGDDEKKTWTKAQEASFASVWNNEEDSIYDDL